VYRVERGFKSKQKEGPPEGTFGYLLLEGCQRLAVSLCNTEKAKTGISYYPRNFDTEKKKRAETYALDLALGGRPCSGRLTAGLKPGGRLERNRRGARDAYH